MGSCHDLRIASNAQLLGHGKHSHVHNVEIKLSYAFIDFFLVRSNAAISHPGSSLKPHSALGIPLLISQARSHELAQHEQHRGEAGNVLVAYRGGEHPASKQGGPGNGDDSFVRNAKKCEKIVSEPGKVSTSINTVNFGKFQNDYLQQFLSPMSEISRKQIAKNAC